jgi:hypothetical protein
MNGTVLGFLCAVLLTSADLVVWLIRTELRNDGK